MTPITVFEARGMTELEFLEECFDSLYTYDDYLVSCELCERRPMSKRLYEGHMMSFVEREYAK